VLQVAAVAAAVSATAALVVGSSCEQPVCQGGGGVCCCGSSCERQSLWAVLCLQLVKRGSQGGAVKEVCEAAGVCCPYALGWPQTSKSRHGLWRTESHRHPRCYVVAAVCSGDFLFVTDTMAQHCCTTVACGCQSLLESKSASVLACWLMSSCGFFWCIGGWVLWGGVLQWVLAPLCGTLHTPTEVTLGSL